MRKYLDSPTSDDYVPHDVKDFGIYTSLYTDDSIGADPAEIPANGKLILDYRPQQTTLSVAINSVPAQIVSDPVIAAASGTVSVNWLSGVLTFHSSDIGKSVTATYKHYGSVIDAGHYNALQKAVEEAVVIGANAALVNAVNTFTEKQTIDTNSANEPILELSALLQPGIKFVDKDSEVDAEIYLSGNIGHFFASHGIDAPFFIGSHSGNGSGLTLINANSISSGTVPLARMHPDVATKNGTNTLTNPFNTFTGTFTGNGAALNSLNATQLTTGTLPDARLSSNVARRDQANTFTQAQTFNGVVTSPGNMVSGVRFLGAGTHNILDNDYYLYVDINAGAITLNFPNSNSTRYGKSYKVITSSQHASNKLTFKAATGENISTPTTFANTFESTPGTTSKRLYDVVALWSGQWVVTSYQLITS